MISTKLKKQANPKKLLIQFSDKQLPIPLQLFYADCKQEGLMVRRDTLKANELNFFHVQLQNEVVSSIKLHDVPSQLLFAISVLYINRQEQQLQLQQSVPIKRTLLLREGLDSKYYIDFEFQNTLSEQQSLVYLCQLSAALINSRLQKQINFYDQRSQQIRGRQELPKQKLWKNIFYQIPGLGKQKCIAIANKYPNYESLFKDFEGPQQLKNLSVSRGVKEMKLGNVLATRIYKCLFSPKGEQSVYDE